MFPSVRMRRLRASEGWRGMVRETTLRAENLVLPIFVNENVRSPQDVVSMPGVCALPLEGIADEAIKIEEGGIGAVLVFGVPKKKDLRGSEAWNDGGVVQQAVRAIKERTGLLVITDLCLCGYTSHGHCGVLVDGDVRNDETLDLYAKVAVSQARAGANMIAPSGMMDGQVRRIRTALDEGGFQSTPIMAYSAKFGSSFYGPFRDAAGSAPQSGDRRSHQLDPANGREAMREMELDLAEGADVLMVKPALPYLDVIREARERFDVPIAAYNVSGEYSMLKAAAMNGWLDERRTMMEILTSIKRAGADIIITYHALDAARALKEGA